MQPNVNVKGQWPRGATDGPRTPRALFIPDKMVGGIDEQEQGWVAKCIANITRWDYVLTPMEIFDPPVGPAS